MQPKKPKIMTHDVFISYSTDDQKIVEGLSAYLEQNGIRCFVAYRDIPRGRDWAEFIPPAIENCKMMIYVHSSSANISKEIDKEIALCLKNHHPILPFKIQNVQYSGAKAYHLETINWLDAFPNPEKYFGKLRDDILRLIPEIGVKNENKKPADTNISKPINQKPGGQLKLSKWLIPAAVAVVAIIIGIALLSNRPKTPNATGDGNYNASVQITKSNIKGVEGVKINGVIWAPCNVDAPGSFAAKPEDPGMFYQWNRKKAWPATGEVTGWDTTIPEGSAWEKSNDPSPAGWRVPTLDEIKTLLDTEKVTNEWITLNGVNGRKFTDRTSGKSIFLPAAGGRHNTDGTMFNEGLYGVYWSSSHDIDLLYVFCDGAGWNTRSYKSNCFPVRPVAE